MAKTRDELLALLNCDSALVNLQKLLKEETSQDSDLPVKPIQWNFNKFLISRDGTEITRYGSAKLPKNLAKDIEALL